MEVDEEERGASAQRHHEREHVALHDVSRRVEAVGDCRPDENRHRLEELHVAAREREMTRSNSLENVHAKRVAIPTAEKAYIRLGISLKN